MWPQAQSVTPTSSPAELWKTVHWLKNANSCYFPSHLNSRLLTTHALLFCKTKPISYCRISLSACWLTSLRKQPEVICFVDYLPFPRTDKSNESCSCLYTTRATCYLSNRNLCVSLWHTKVFLPRCTKSQDRLFERNSPPGTKKRFIEKLWW
jgi:hypothetical protein